VSGKHNTVSDLRNTTLNGFYVCGVRVYGLNPRQQEAIRNAALREDTTLAKRTPEDFFGFLEDSIRFLTNVGMLRGANEALVSINKGNPNSNEYAVRSQSQLSRY
jgi:hypothetical protein